MRRPSGDQDGFESWVELLVRRVTPEPSAFITYISSLLSPWEDWKAIHPPSGDHSGRRSLLLGRLVSRATPEPSAFIAYISEFPLLVDENAMRRPSGDQDGAKSPPESSVRRATPEPSAFIA